ncbi:MAG: hypothetical protein A2252_00035 [Elusimicrobia bacterium RIFOXYA2_FULL_39_19]|nr:MAG: hypothetical protein A2252_00035 [Elusimicrobia bacterium RIFOXYA2_FULL_39_19]
MSVTIKDIAKEANVNFSTVSLALNNHPRISSETKAKINAIAKKLNYIPNISATSLKNKKTQTIGLVIHALTNPFFVQLLANAEDAAYDHKNDLIVCFSGYKMDREEEYMNLLMKRKVDGLLITHMTNNVQEESFLKILKKLKENKFPFVLLMEDIDLDCNCIYIDYAKGEYDLINYLIKIGHKHIAFAYNGTMSKSLKKLEGYKKALKENGIEIKPELIISKSFNTYKHYEEITEQLLSANPRPTVLVTADDYMALRFQEEFRNRGLMIPQDIALAGFDDIAFLNHLKFPLTTVRISPEKIAKLGVEMLLGQIENPEAELKKIVIDPELIIRESCGVKTIMPIKS